MAALKNEIVSDLKTTVKNSIVRLQIDRPDRSNALTPEVVRGMISIFDEIEDHDGGIRCAIIASSNTRAFCAGFDIDHIESPGAASSAPESLGSERDLVDNLASTVAASRVPVVAEVGGAAVGAGCDLAIACDIRIGTPNSRLGMPTAKLGLMYGIEGIRRLVSVAGPALAKEMLITGSLLPADRAVQAGLLSEVVESDAISDRVWAVAEEVVSNAPLSVQGSKQVVDLVVSAQTLSTDAIALIEQIQRRVWTSEDAEEGARAFREGRAPEFRGR